MGEDAQDAGSALGLRVSIERIRPRAIVPRTMKPWARFGAPYSAAYFALPVTFATPSTRPISFPM
jgi:hypothetical protein